VSRCFPDTSVSMRPCTPVGASVESQFQFTCLHLSTGVQMDDNLHFFPQIYFVCPLFFQKTLVSSFFWFDSVTFCWFVSTTFFCCL
jgi:hypothetical protein